MSSRLTNFTYKIFGDHRGKTLALKKSGFKNEAEAVQWANSITVEPLSEMSELTIIKQIRDNRPDLTLATASYIAKRSKARFA
ncbi:hypothetical protein [Rothia terrae]|uniref:Uncharacterized protein n=1 Tax=Rothia terrae TaxID=396015 RepID=A0A7S6WWP7_9MICC|nr:hypothetical protein [Rothia terrae]QOW64712.1 hypothetical protein IDM49_11455 [Rothia terrae]